MTTTRAGTAATRATTADFVAFAVTVRRIEKMGAHFVRVTLGGDDLEHFHAAGLDQRVKLIFPLATTGLTTFPRGGSDWYAGWRDLPEHERCPMRTYTVRAARTAAGEIDVDFAVHGDTGPATRWVNRASVGDELLVVGPDARTLVVGAGPIGGVEFRAGDADRVLLAGDETAAPAICSIIEQLPADTRGQVFIEVATDDDILPVTAPGRMTVTWLARDTRDASHGEALNRAVRAWVSEMVAPAAADEPVETTGNAPLGDADADAEPLWDVPPATGEHHGLYAWIAGEASCIRELRRFLVRDTGLHRNDVAFMGYWRAGRPES
ncbi:siderophore-interacting protein [Marisediminicola senii]|uniref:siderophore-interacting protein n=1 Tax=Marisediminicola senii TaxID=2711233 RepID=UPI0013EB852E|nr:siderophore-interacting protein [Marisediminicola senii]